MALADEIKTLTDQGLNLEADAFVSRMKLLLKRTGLAPAVPIFARLLTQPETNIHLRFLLLSAIGQPPDNAWLPVLTPVLARERNIRVLNEALNALVRLGSTKAYLTLLAFWRGQTSEDVKSHALTRLEAMARAETLILHLDALLRRSDDSKALAAGADYLIEHLPGESLGDLVPYLESEPDLPRLHILRILRDRPDGSHVVHLFAFFQRHAAEMHGELFQVAAEAMVNHAVLMPRPGQIFNRLNELRASLGPEERIGFALLLLKLDSAALLPELQPLYASFSSDRRIRFLANLNPRDGDSFRPFLRRELRQENMPQPLQHIVVKLLATGDAAFLFDTLQRETGLRRRLILEFMIAAGPPGLEKYIAALLRQAPDDQAALLAIEYLLKHDPDNYATVLRAVLGSGLSDEVKRKIVRSLPLFAPPNILAFINQFFEHRWYGQGLKKDFLIALARVLHDHSLPFNVEDRIVNNVLIGLEEAEPADIVHFMTFFEAYTIKTQNHSGLICGEWRLIQQAVLKNTQDQALVKPIYKYIQKTEKLKLP
jgi:hypothetical protein